MDIDDLSEEDKLIELQKCSESFEYFCENYVKITHPERGMIPFNLYQYQKRVVAQFEKNRHSIMSKFRQAGLTTMTSIWSLWRCLFKMDQRILLVSIGDREAKEAGRTVKIALEELPDWMQPKMGKNNDHEKEFSDTNGIIWFLTPKAVRSKALTILVIDEAAFINGMDDLWASMMPSLSAGGKCIVISTVNGMGNWYQKMYYNALSEKNRFKVIEIDYTEHPDYSKPGWAEDMRADLGEKKFAQEILRSFLGSGDTYIDVKVIRELEVLVKNNHPNRMLFPEWDTKVLDFKPDDLPNEDYRGGALWVWKDREPGREYIIAADVADGVGQNGDFSAFHVLDVAECEQVAEFYSNTITPHIYAQILSELGCYYNNAHIVVDGYGPGAATLNRLANDLYYNNLYEEKVGRPGIKISNNRGTVLEAMQYALTNRTVKLHSRRLLEEIRTFNFNPKKRRAEAQSGTHDDLIMALAVGLYVRDEKYRHLPVGAEALLRNRTTSSFEADIKDRIRKAIHDVTEEMLLELETNSMITPEEDLFLKAQLNFKRTNDALLKEFNW